MKTETRKYKDVAGNSVKLDWLVKNEPEWAANQIRHRDRLEAELQQEKHDRAAVCPSCEGSDESVAAPIGVATGDLLGIIDKYADIIYNAPLPHPDHIHAAVLEAVKMAYVAAMDDTMTEIRDLMYAPRTRRDSVGQMTLSMLAKKILARRDAAMPNIPS